MKCYDQFGNSDKVLTNTSKRLMASYNLQSQERNTY